MLSAAVMWQQTTICMHRNYDHMRDETVTQTTVNCTCENQQN